MKNLVRILMLGTLVLPIAARADDQILRVAVFPFESETHNEASPQFQNFIHQAISQMEGKKEGKQEESRALTLGDKISEILTAELSGNPGIQLVERAKIDKAFDELALGKTGLVDDAAAARIGHMVGAQVLITGRAFPVDDELFIIGKVVGVETGRVFAAKADGPLSGKLNSMVQTLSGSISKVLLKHDAELVGKETKEKDYEALIRQAVGDAKRPRVSVFVKERHMSQESLDPPVETEAIYLLQKTGFTVTDERNKQLSDWAAAYLEDTSQKAPVSGNSDVIIVGGDLVSCKARAELRAIDAKSGQVLAIDRKSATAVDLAEHTAAKAALQKAADELLLNLIPEMVKKWNGK